MAPQYTDEQEEGEHVLSQTERQCVYETTHFITVAV